MLFNVAIDVLQKLIGVVNEVTREPISNKILDSMVAFQYANDTVIIANAKSSTVITLKIILRLFTKASGLHINYSKSTLVPLNLGQDELQIIGSIMGCKYSSFPITYLGMPLTVVKPSRHMFMPLLEKIEKRLEGWQRKLILRGG